MDQILQLISGHPGIAAAVAYWIFSAAVSSMPDITDKNGPGYIWIYRFLHTIAGNLTTAFGDKISAIAKAAGNAAAANGTKLLIILLIPFMLVASSCGYKVHPNAINKFDSAAYDSLLEAQIFILNAHDLQTQAKLSKSLLPALIAMEKAYNVAQPAYLIWHSAALIDSPNAPKTLTDLNKDLVELAAAVTAFRKGQ